MRKTLFVIIGLSLFVISNEVFGQIRYGIFADPQLTWFNSDTKSYSPNGPTASINFGFNAERYFAERYAVASGLSINSLGGNIKYNISGDSLVTTDGNYQLDSTASVRFKGQYLTLPIGFKFKTIEIGYLTFFANIGVAANIRLKGFAWEELNDVDKQTATTHFTPIFANYFIGGGIQYSLGGPSKLEFGVIYNGGLSRSLETSRGIISTSGISLRIGVIF